MVHWVGSERNLGGGTPVRAIIVRETRQQDFNGQERQLNPFAEMQAKSSNPVGLWGFPYCRVLLLLAFNRHFHCSLQTKWELSLRRKWSVQFQAVWMNTVGLPQCTTLPSCSSWARASVEAKDRVPAKSPQAPNPSSCGWLSSNFQEGKANGTFFCSKICTIAFFFLNEDHTLYSWKWLQRFIHSSVSICWASIQWKAQGTKQMEKISPCPAAPSSPSGSRWENHSHLCRHLASSTQEAAVLQDSAKPLPPTPRRCEGMGPGNVLASHVIFSSRGKLCNLLFGPTVWIVSTLNIKKKRQQSIPLKGILAFSRR